MDAEYDALERKKLQLLEQLAELEVEQQRPGRVLVGGVPERLA